MFPMDLHTEGKDVLPRRPLSSCPGRVELSFRLFGSERPRGGHQLSRQVGGKP
jgi:hypothetical protein